MSIKYNKKEDNFEDAELKQPGLNNARINSFGGYKALYKIEPIDEEQKIWKGKPVVEPQMARSLPSAQLMQAMRGWMIFSRRYDDRSDWDRMYPELSFDDKLIGLPFLLVPKEKLLFAYDEPTAIELPPPGMIFK